MTISISSGEAEATAPATAFEVIDALGLAQLVKRSGDLDGSVPLRVAQACTPLYEGNAFGFQVSLRQSITIRRSEVSERVAIASPFAEALTAGHRAVVPRLLAQGLISPDSPLRTGLANQFLKLESEGSGNVRVGLWTGLLVRPDSGVWLRVSSTANRRNHFLEVAEQFIADEGRFVPLILEITLRSEGPDHVLLAGEIATLAPVAPGARIDQIPLAKAPEVAAAHASFFDAAYFESKAGGPTRKYRRMKPPLHVAESNSLAHCRLIHVGRAAHSVTGEVARIIFANQVSFEASFDGYTMSFELNERDLREGVRELERTFAEALGPRFLGDNRHAMRYFTRYFTPHTPGEPHFFVAPWGFVQTPPGWSCLLEGVHGDGFDVLRGVVATDMFYTTPAVFQVYRAGEPIRVGRGEPLLHVIPIPRRLLRAGFREIALRDGTPMLAP